MKAALLLVDLQNDYLATPRLLPAAGTILTQTEFLLNQCRALSIPVVHIWTTINSCKEGHDERMPHWRKAGKWQLVSATEGHQTPSCLRPLPNEIIVNKHFYNGFADGTLESALRQHDCDTVLIAGLHLHACVRIAAVEAYERGFNVGVVEDAVASNDPLHASITRRYLEERTMEFATAEQWVVRLKHENLSPKSLQQKLHALPVAIVDATALEAKTTNYQQRHSPINPSEELAPVSVAEKEQISDAIASAQHGALIWRHSSLDQRSDVLRLWADGIESDTELPLLITKEIGKPIRYAREEITGTVEQLHALAARAKRIVDPEVKDGIRVRHRPLGVVAVITPWNNPAYIPAGKLGAALLFGNAAVWKPAPASAAIAIRLLQYLHQAGLPAGTINLVQGNASTARLLMAHPATDAVTLTGSRITGFAAQDYCSQLGIPLQAELGGNNAAIVWADADLDRAAECIAEGAFAQAGQRCTANRRVVVASTCYDSFLTRLQQATAKLQVGDPLDSDTQVGPLITSQARQTVLQTLARASESGLNLIQPHVENYSAIQWKDLPTYHLPTIVPVSNHAEEIVQEELFGPVLVVQRARDWEQAIALCNGVEQGLVAALFSHSKEIQTRFLNEAAAGVLKLNSSTAGAKADVPFGGWKASGMGPPEHGESDREFYTRTQSVYQ